MSLESRKRVIELIDRIEQLEAFIHNLGIMIMHPDMGGNHQCKIEANGRTLTGDQWRIIHTCRPYRTLGEE